MAGHYEHKSMREVVQNRVVVRKAKRASKCKHGCIIPIGDVVVLTDFETRENHSNKYNFQIKRPQRFCAKHGKEFLFNIFSIINGSLNEITRLSSDDNSN